MSRATLSLGTTVADVAWIVVLVLCVVVMTAPFVFLAAVTWARRREGDAAS